MFKAKRISITLNARQIGDAQILAALESLGGEPSSIIKALALRGIMSDPTMSTNLSQGISLMNSSRKAEGCGFTPTKCSDAVSTHSVSEKMEKSASTKVSKVDHIPIPDVNCRQVTILPVSALLSKTAVLDVTKTTKADRKGNPTNLSDFLNW